MHPSDSAHLTILCPFQFRTGRDKNTFSLRTFSFVRKQFWQVGCTPEALSPLMKSLFHSEHKLLGMPGKNSTVFQPGSYISIKKLGKFADLRCNHDRLKLAGLATTNEAFLGLLF